MADVDEKVLSAVAAALAENPDATVDELFEMAKGLNPAIGELSKRQFHARYPLQIKRRKSANRRRRARKRTASRSTSKERVSRRESVRRTFLRFASDLAAAESRKDLVSVVSNVDSYVDEVLAARGR